MAFWQPALAKQTYPYRYFTEWNSVKVFRPVLLREKLRGLSPRANYTDRAAAAGRRS